MNKTRNQAGFSLGISPRASKKFVKAIKASAYIHNRDYVIRDDILNLYLPVMGHRVEAETPGEEKILLEELLHAANF